MEDDDSFSDEDIAALPSSTLLQLEQKAYEATRQRTDSNSAALAQHLLNPRPRSFALDSNSDPSSRAPSRGPVLQDPSLLHRPPLSFGETDFQDLDAGVLDDGNGPVPVEVQDTSFASGPKREIIPPHQDAVESRDGVLSKDLATREWHRSLAEGRDVPHRHARTVAEADDTISRATANLTLEGAGSNTSTAAARSMAETEDMREQIEQLTRERDRVLQELNSAKAMAETKAGEIAIIRAKQAKMEKSHNRQLTVLRTAMVDETKKHHAEMEAAIMESKRILTENAFLRQDLQDQSHRVEAIQQNQRARAKLDENAPPATPKKDDGQSLRDGFSKDELASPSKSAAGKLSRRGTPSGSGKRKRKATNDSPIPAPALPLHQPHGGMVDDAPTVSEPMATETSQPPKPKKEDRNVRFMRNILDHRTHPNKERDLEVFAQLSFPSEPGRKLSSIVLEATTTRSSESYPLEYAKAVMSLWTRAMDEKFYKPVNMFMAIIKFILNLDAFIAPRLIEDLVPLLHKSGFVNGEPRFKSSPVSHLNLGEVKQTPQKDLDHDVNATEALDILYLLAIACLHDEDAFRLFWRTMRYDFILIMLNSSQPISDITIMLNILSCSILPTSFGPIFDTPEEQATNEGYLIDRAANLLSEVPCVDEGEEPYNGWQISTLRIEVMSLLMDVAFSSPDPPHNRAGQILAKHPTALARIFRAMHDEVDALYSYRPEHELHVALVNGLTRLAYGVIHNYRELVDLQAKLRIVPGAVQKHLVVLTRLAFSEGPLLEAGIDDDTVEMAHAMLEDALNPEEAYALEEALRPKTQV